jgi:hypothetical protein
MKPYYPNNRLPVYLGSREIVWEWSDIPVPLTKPRPGDPSFIDGFRGRCRVDACERKLMP